MKATELRIGNWIQDEENTHYQVEVEDIENLNYYEKYQETMFPIPLTEEWLVKFGFEYSDLNGDSGLWKIPPFQIYGKCNQFIYDYRLDVNYVHQLQNLYFALTYEELQTDETEQKVNQ